MGAFLMTLAGPLARQVLISLGIGLISFVGLDTAIQSAFNAAKSNFAGMDSGIVAIAARAGLFTAFSIVAGGILAGVSMLILKRFGPTS